MHASFICDSSSDSVNRRRIPICSFDTNFDWIADESFRVGMHAEWCSIGRFPNLVGHTQRAKV